MGYAFKIGGVSANIEIQFIKLGTSSSYNIKNLYPTIYTNLTTNNFFYRIANGSKQSASSSSVFGNNISAWFTAPSISYNKSTGVLSCGNGVSYGQGVYNHSGTAGPTVSTTCTTTKYMYYIE